jgi:Fe-S-cluster containining protein
MMQPGADALFQAVYRAAGRPEVRQGIHGVYAGLARALEQRKPVCNLSGRCCRFEEFGHRLYVTTLELAAFLYDWTTGPSLQPPGDWDGRGCPFQVAGRCGVHEIRPFGCRIYFCDPTSTEWQHEHYERFHADLKRLHTELSVPYFYVEWREALGILGLSEQKKAVASGRWSVASKGISLPATDH